jgi:hypothetical protein
VRGRLQALVDVGAGTSSCRCRSRTISACCARSRTPSSPPSRRPTWADRVRPRPNIVAGRKDGGIYLPLSIGRLS